MPNEEENASTTQIQMTVPSGFDLGNIAPVAGWTATVSGNTVTWKGKLDGEELALLPFTGSSKNEGDYAFKVRQTYSDGSVVDWAGTEDSDTPAPAIAVGAAEHGAEESHSDSSKTIAIIALVVGALGLLVGGAGLPRGAALGVSWGGRAGALLVALVVALAVPAVAWGHATLLATQPQASGVLTQPPSEVRLTFTERIEPRFAVISVTDAQGTQKIDGRPTRRPTTRTRSSSPCSRSRRAGTSSGGASSRRTAIRSAAPSRSRSARARARHRSS